MKKIIDIAKKIGVRSSSLQLYGEYKAKIDFKNYLNKKRKGHLILVTAMTPTKVGEGKTTTAIGLADGLNKIKKDAIVVLREPSMGPVFGLKGGGTGGGKASIVPEDDINLHFTGDLHAITSINNLIAAFIDNEIFQKSELNLDLNSISFPRAIDMNDRSLREIETCLKKGSGERHRSKFVITTASEIMACFCLAKDEDDFIRRVNSVEIGKDYEGRRHFVADLKLDNAIRKLVKDAINPNLVQTLHGTPAIVHGGPFANIAHGCNSIIATDLALKLSSYVVTEAGFGADLGMEKFFDIVCQENSLKPELTVVVATLQALKLHGNVPFEELDKINKEAVKEGCKNLFHHLKSVEKYHVSSLVCINIHPNDKREELVFLENYLTENNIEYVENTSYSDGEIGAVSFAKKAVEIIDRKESDFLPLYDDKEDIYSKVDKIAKEIYGADEVIYDEKVKKQIDDLIKDGYGDFKVCISKTPLSLSDDPKKLNVPSFSLHINSLRLFFGAKFVVPMSGNVIAMPGLNKNPRGKNM